MTDVHSGAEENAGSDRFGLDDRTPRRRSDPLNSVSTESKRLVVALGKNRRFRSRKSAVSADNASVRMTSPAKTIRGVASGPVFGASNPPDSSM